MKILILHRIPYHKIQYHRGIDHDYHEVTYIGTESALANIPDSLKCEKIVRPGVQSPSAEIIKIIANQPNVRFDKVISLSEYELLEAAKVRESLLVDGPTVEEVLLVRDKVLMKKAIANSGIRAPRFVKLTEVLQSPNVDWTGPTVLKPIDGASSENVKVFSNFTECMNFIKSHSSAIANFDEGRFEIEEFVQGPILHIDGLVVKGEIKCWLPSEYLGTCLDYAQGQPLGSIQLTQDSEIESFTKDVIKALQIREGSFHLEAIRDNDGLVFLEIANRVGGADVVDTFERATGVYLPAAELSALVGDTHFYNLENQHQMPKEKYGWFVFPGHHLPAGYADISGFDKFKSNSTLVRFNELTDNALPRNITYQSAEVPLAGVICGSTSEEVFSWMKSLFATVEVQSIIQKPSTTRVHHA